MAIKTVFPPAEVKGCLFYFNLFRKIQKVGLQSHYGSPEVRRFVRRCGAMSLVPLESIDEAWLITESESPGPTHEAYQALEIFKAYFIDTYLENETVFPRSMWNHYANFGPRTTNNLESWHNALNHAIQRSHVDIFTMITHLKRQEAKFRIDMMMLRAGQTPPRPNNVYDDLNNNLIDLVRSLEHGEISLSEYLSQAAMNIPHFQ